MSLINTDRVSQKTLLKEKLISSLRIVFLGHPVHIGYCRFLVLKIVYFGFDFYIFIFRVLKLARHSPGLQAIAYTLRHSYKELALLVFLMGISSLIIGSLCYYIELDEDSGFTSIPTSIYYCIITMTTVGYGDIFPTTGIFQIYILLYSLIITQLASSGSHLCQPLFISLYLYLGFCSV